MLSKEEFEYHLDQHIKAWNPYKKPKSTHPALTLPLEKQREILEATMAVPESVTTERMHSQSSLAGVLLGEGVPVDDDLLVSWLQRHADFHAFVALPLEGLVKWVEHRQASNPLSIRLLTCLRTHHPRISKRATDKSHRSLMHRMAVALGLVSSDVIPVPKDAWTAKALAWRDSLPDQNKEAWEALLKLASAQKSSTPSKSYLKNAAELVAALPQFSMIMRDILEALGRDGPVGVTWRGYPSSIKNLLDDDYTDLLRPLIWLCSPYPELTDSLRDAAARCSTKIKNIGPLCAKIAAACAETLSRQAVDAATPSLSNLQSAVKHKSTQKALAKAMITVADKAGSGWSELEEKHVPDHGFKQGHRIGSFTAKLAWSHSGTPELLWHQEGAQPQKAVPIEVQRSHSDQLKETKLLFRDVKKTYRAQVLRLEKLMCEGRDLPYEIWQEHYFDHPIVGALTRRLFWRFGTELVYLAQNSAASDDRLAMTLDGRSIVGSSGMNIHLWHPAELKCDENQQWQKWALTNRLIQPFQQALREVHRPADDLDATDDHRYHKELLHQGAFAALCRERGWLYSFHGSPEQFSPCIHYPRLNMRAVMNVSEEPDPHGRAILWLQIADIKFYQADKIVPLRLVPAVIYSEVMRDIGLFVSASKATKDSGWRDTIPSKEMSE
jgi:hypothetical protein